MITHFEGVVIELWHRLHVQETEASGHIRSLPVDPVRVECAEPHVEPQDLLAREVRAVLVLVQVVLAERRRPALLLSHDRLAGWSSV